MAFSFLATNSRYLRANAPLTGNPMTIGFWFRSNGLNGCGVSIGDEGSQQRHNIFVLPASGSVINAGSSNSGGTVASVNSTTTFTDGQWSHACGVYASDSSRTAFCNGGGAATNTTLIATTPGFVDLFVGTRPSPNLGGFFTGDIAEVGIWNVALTAAEIASLAKGMTCDKVRPQSLVFYAPLVRNLQDAKGGLTITNNGGATVATHPRVYA